MQYVLFLLWLRDIAPRRQQLFRFYAVLFLATLRCLLYRLRDHLGLVIFNKDFQLLLNLAVGPIFLLGFCGVSPTLVLYHHIVDHLSKRTDVSVTP